MQTVHNENRDQKTLDRNWVIAGLILVLMLSTAFVYQLDIEDSPYAITDWFGPTPEERADLPT